MSLKSILVVSALASAVAASAQMRITEWEYNGSEFVEFTNVGHTALNLANYSFDDDSRTAGTVSLAAFGTVASHESVILAEQSADAFRAQWGLSSSVKVIGNNAANLGRADEINLFDGTTLVDRLTYNDQGTGNAKGPRTDVASANISLPNLGTNVAANGVLSKVGDVYGSFTSVTGGFVANPGIYTPVPEPATIAALGLGAVAAIRRRRKS